MLFWVALMADGGEDAVIARWKEVVTATVSERTSRGNLAAIALVFAELAGHGLAWKQGLEGFEMTESQVVNEWISQGKLEERRQNLLRLLKGKFPGLVSEEVSQVILHQESLELLADWFDAAITAISMSEFVQGFRQ